ncbi:MAG: 4-alpha-glucanotransferase [Verrucomicrobiota bacterium]
MSLHQNGEPLYDWLDKRASGVLLHISSLPSDTGVGNFGAAAYRFVNFLKDAKVKIWQICPLGPTGFGDSPYQCFSAFAGNPYFIDLEPLLLDGLITSEDLLPLNRLSTEKVEYGYLYENFWRVIEKAYENFAASGAKSVSDYGTVQAFQKAQAFWLNDYALFMALKAQNNGQCWLEWPATSRDYTKAKKKRKTKALKTAIDAQVFFQYLFHSQLEQLRNYAGQNGIELLGDVPIFVALDSSDVWSNPELFQLDEDLHPTAVAGVPPDYFSEDGQLWGNPLYDWDKHLETGFSWWIERMKANLAFYDIIRIDHFRGFESFWSVPAGAKTARNGQWVKCPGIELFQAIRQACPDAKIVAEDLGVITHEVDALRRQTGLPGMAVLQFAFGGGNDSPYLPHNVSSNTVIYSGTHDNDTTVGWYEGEPEHVKEHVRRYICVSGEDIAWDFIRAAMKSRANLSVVPLQDIMRLGAEARLNTPGAAMGNWQWRYSDEQLEQTISQSLPALQQLVAETGR